MSQPAPFDQISFRVPSIDELGFDRQILRRKYHAERKNRLRAEGVAQYKDIEGSFARCKEDPYIPEKIVREALDEDIEVAILGGDCGGMLYSHACFQTQVRELRWHEKQGHWVVRTDRNDLFRAKYVVMSSGSLNRPKLPGIPGVEPFKGHMFHTSRWDYDYTGGDTTGNLHKLGDKRVAVIGTGATASSSRPVSKRAAPPTPSKRNWKYSVVMGFRSPTIGRAPSQNRRSGQAGRG